MSFSNFRINKVGSIFVEDLKQNYVYLETEKLEMFFPYFLSVYSHIHTCEVEIQRLLDLT